MKTGARWRRELAAAVRTPQRLYALLGLDPTDLGEVGQASSRFSTLVPHSYLRRIRRGDPRDPLLLQVLPQARELWEAHGYGGDPVAEVAAQPVPGILRKYHGRALLLATAACAIHCRYCFRREFPYDRANAGTGDWRRTVDYLRRTPAITEVILSGGDPLLVSTQRLATLARALQTIPHVQRIRIHSRVPVVLPSRVDSALLEWLGETSPRRVLVIHANHPNEIDAEVVSALHRLRQLHTPVLNQSVLLAGVNDDTDVLGALSERLFEAGVLPYYLHLLDPVRGASHFHVSPRRARHLHRQLRERLPGYLVPRLVREQAGAAAKLPL